MARLAKILQRDFHEATTETLLRVVQPIPEVDLDMMIAAHAKASNTTLVSRDRAFWQMGEGVQVKVW